MIRRTPDDFNLTDDELLHTFLWWDYMNGEDATTEVSDELAKRIAVELVKRGAPDRLPDILPMRYIRSRVVAVADGA